MKWIGIDKEDPEQRKFEFDDEVVLSSEPPQFSIRLLDTNEVSSVLCKNVFKLKPVKPLKKTQASTPQPKKEQKMDELQMPVISTDNKEFDELVQKDIFEELRPKRKQYQTPKQPNTITLNPDDSKTGTFIMGEQATNSETSLQLDESVIKDIINKTNSNHKYEYKTMLVDLENVEMFETKLNELGENRWDLISVSVAQSLLPNKSRLFCIFKRNKQ